MLEILSPESVPMNQPPRARDLGIPFEGKPGVLNAITDVAGVEVGHTTLIEGEGPLIPGEGPIRTGVTTILPRGKHFDPVFAAHFSWNGNGEMTGTAWVEESGFLEGPVAITNSHSVGVVRDALIQWQIANHMYEAMPNGAIWLLPVVAETYDGRLNDINGFHVKPEHVFAALDSAAPGPVVEGSVGGGTGMVSHGYKGGIGTASRIAKIEDARYTVGVLVQSNHGARRSLTLAGVPVGQHLTDEQPEIHSMTPANTDVGSIIVIVATDAPLLPHQLKGLAKRVPVGVGRVGAFGSQTSGDIFLAFSTANSGAGGRSGISHIDMLPNDDLNPLFEATVQATEEAIVNSMVASSTMTGINGNTVYGIPHDRVREVLRRFGRLAE
jgi:D-aminopeptidase